MVHWRAAGHDDGADATDGGESEDPEEEEEEEEHEGEEDAKVFAQLAVIVVAVFFASPPFSFRC
jgi:hypothetical protein